MKKVHFVGRKKALERLQSFYKKEAPTLVVIKGRRRVGKSRLVSFFAENFTQGRFWSFSGLAPKKNMEAQDERDHFANQLAHQLNMSPFTFRDWTDAFEYLGRHIQPKDSILFDEISWMGHKDPTFIPKLKAWWDQRHLVMMFFCGSVSTWIEENILKSTAFFGRINFTLTLDPLSLDESAELLHLSGFQGSDYETYQLLGVLGGIPWYLEQVVSGFTVSDLIKNWCFLKDGLLVSEFDRIFHDLFDRKGASYKKVLNSLKDGAKTLADIRKLTEFPQSGTLSLLIEHLIVAGFVQKHTLWSFKTHRPLKQSLYRISDPYMRFYLKLIEPKLDKIRDNSFENTLITSFPGFEAHMGLQIEQLLLQNKNRLIEALGINPLDIVSSGPFKQGKTLKKPGVQIDFLLQTVTKNLFVCECKFKRGELCVSILSEVQKKIDALKAPKGFAKIPVLFHIGGVSENVATSDYFYRIIDIRDFLKK